MSFLNNCRQFTNLSAMKANFLQRINTVLPLVSDLVHAHVAMYTFSQKENYFTVVSEFEPHTTYNPIKQSLIGKEIPKVQEPLIDKTIKFKSKYEGQRELDFGKFYQMYTIPIVVDYEVIAVICCEIFVRALADEKSDLRYLLILRRTGYDTRNCTKKV